MSQKEYAPGPLAGVKVLDLTQIMAGPMCTMLLADMGADVIKIERPGSGDDTRRMGSRYENGFAAGFLALNRNKRSIALDLRSDEGKGVFRKMAETADIVAENFRPGVMDRLGLGYDALSEINPRLVYASISGFGGSGPYRNRGGFDLVAQGMSGLMSITGFPGGPPAKVGVPITDIGAGSFTAFGILAAYIHSQRTGQGQQVDASLLEAGIAFTVWESAEYFCHRRDTGAAGFGAPRERAVPGFTHQRRAHQHWRGVATDVGAVLPGHRAGGANRGPALQSAQRPQGAGGGAGGNCWKEYFLNTQRTTGWNFLSPQGLSPGPFSIWHRFMPTSKYWRER